MSTLTEWMRRFPPALLAAAAFVALPLLAGCDGGDSGADSELDGSDDSALDGSGDATADGSGDAPSCGGLPVQTDQHEHEASEGSALGAFVEPTWAVIDDTFQDGSGWQPVNGQLSFDARTTAQQITPTGAPTTIWSYGNHSPAGPIRVRQHAPLDVRFTNRLDIGTTIHWHGLQQDIANDGVPGISQSTMKPGQSFTYHLETGFTGTYWFHPHTRTAEGVDRGLQGVIVVEEENPPPVDRDLVWVVDDWNLGPDNQVLGVYDNVEMQIHGGVIGNTLTVNGRSEYAIQLPAGALVRLRLVATSNGRTHHLRWPCDVPASVVATDGGYVQQPWSVNDLLIAPAERYELVFRVPNQVGRRITFASENYILSHTQALAQIVVGPPEASQAPDWVQPAVDIPDWSDLRRGQADLLLQISGNELPGETDLDFMWTLNGMSMSEDHTDIDTMPPLADFVTDRIYRIDVSNHNGYNFGHPLHIHGAAFQVLFQEGEDPAVPPRAWKDTIWLPPERSAKIAVRFPKPGQWMVHCHILEHQARGMMTRVNVDQAP